MSHELGATTSIFPSDEITRDFFRRLGRARDWREMLPDADAEYDDMIDMDLAKIEPLIALPSLPDNVVPVRKVAGTKVEQVMVGSCTNGSYTDLQAVAKVMKGRRGLSDDQVYLASPETAAATAIKGVITDPRDLGAELAIAAPEPVLPDAVPQDNPNLIPPASEAEAAGIVVHRGENIQPSPVKP